MGRRRVPCESPVSLRLGIRLRFGTKARSGRLQFDTILIHQACRAEASFVDNCAPSLHTIPSASWTNAQPSVPLGVLYPSGNPSGKSWIGTTHAVVPLSYTDEGEDLRKEAPPGSLPTGRQPLGHGIEVFIEGMVVEDMRGAAPPGRNTVGSIADLNSTLV